MLVGWLLLELLLLIVAVGMIFPRLAIRVPQRLRFGRLKRPAKPRSRLKAVVEVVLGFLIIALVLTDWSGLRLGWQDRSVVKSSGVMSVGRAKLVDGLVNPAIESGELVGCVVGVTDNGRKWYGCYGRGRISDPTPPNEYSVFEIGSITKTFTCTALASMCLSGKLDVDDPVGKYLPKSVRVPAYKGRQITLGDLASQVSGLPRLADNEGLGAIFSDDPYAGYSSNDLYDFLNNHKLRRAPGSLYEYSNLGMGILGLALARASEASYENLITRLVCKPLGMKDTTISLSHLQKKRLVQGYAVHEKHGELILGVPAENWTFQDCTAGAGALRSTASDMLKYLEASIAATHEELGPALAMAQKVRHGTDEEYIDVCLGWHTLKVPWAKEPIIWHNGGTGGYCSYAGFCRERKLGVVVLANTAGDVDLTALRIMKVLLQADAKH